MTWSERPSEVVEVRSNESPTRRAQLISLLAGRWEIVLISYRRVEPIENGNRAEQADRASKRPARANNPSNKPLGPLVLGYKCIFFQLAGWKVSRGHEASDRRVSLFHCATGARHVGHEYVYIIEGDALCVEIKFCASSHANCCTRPRLYSNPCRCGIFISSRCFFSRSTTSWIFPDQSSLLSNNRLNNKAYNDKSRTNLHWTSSTYLAS